MEKLFEHLPPYTPPPVTANGVDEILASLGESASFWKNRSKANNKYSMSKGEIAYLNPFSPGLLTIEGELLLRKDIPLGFISRFVPSGHIAYITQYVESSLDTHHIIPIHWRVKEDHKILSIARNGFKIEAPSLLAQLIRFEKEKVDAISLTISKSAAVTPEEKKAVMTFIKSNSLNDTDVSNKDLLRSYSNLHQGRKRLENIAITLAQPVAKAITRTLLDNELIDLEASLEAGVLRFALKDRTAIYKKPWPRGKQIATLPALTVFHEGIESTLSIAPHYFEEAVLVKGWDTDVRAALVILKDSLVLREKVQSAAAPVAL